MHHEPAPFQDPTRSTLHHIASLNLIDLLLDAACIVAPNSSIVFVNAALERICGYMPDGAVGLRMPDLVRFDELERARQAAQSVSDGSLQLHFENLDVHKSGHAPARSATAAPRRSVLSAP